MATGKKNGMTCTYVVGRYRPAGNIGGQYKKNVPKRSFTKNVCSSLDEMVKEIEKSTGGRTSAVGEVPPPGAPPSAATQGGKPFGTAANGKGDNDGKASTSKGSNGGDSARATSGNSFEQGGLDAHNKFRKIHGTSEIKLNRKMCKEAEDYAKILAKNGGLQHANVKDGENLAYACSSAPGKGLSGAEATKNW